MSYIFKQIHTSFFCNLSLIQREKKGKHIVVFCMNTLSVAEISHLSTFLSVPVPTNQTQPWLQENIQSPQSPNIQYWSWAIILLVLYLLAFIVRETSFKTQLSFCCYHFYDFLPSQSLSECKEITGKVTGKDTCKM